MRAAPQERSCEEKQAIAECAAKVPPMWRGGFIAAATGQASPRRAIRAMCQSCVGYEDVVRRVRECNVLTCPLWPYRPHARRERR